MTVWITLKQDIMRLVLDIMIIIIIILLLF